MPKDNAGKFHMNDQLAVASNKASAPESPTGKGPAGSSVTISSSGGKFQTDSGGEKADHPSIGHALMHVASKMSSGKHMHIHSEHGKHTSHTADDLGVDGPNEHASADEAGQAVSQNMTDEQQPDQQDSSEDDYSDSGDTHRMSGFAPQQKGRY